MQSLATTHASFDDPDLVSRAQNQNLCVATVPPCGSAAPATWRASWARAGLGAVDEQDGGAYLPGVTALRGDVGQVVVHYPALVGCQGLGGHGAHP